MSKYDILHPVPLNLSDHLPISVQLDIRPLSSKPVEPSRLNWNRALELGLVHTYQLEVSRHLSSSIHSPPPSSPDEVEKELIAFSDVLLKCALDTIPVCKKRFIRDSALKEKCDTSKRAWKDWKAAGRPRSGPLYSDMKLSKAAVRNHVKLRRAA